MNYSRIIPITDLRRNFGEITANLADIDSLLLTRGGEPFATLKATPNVKRKKLMKSFGAWKGTKLDDDKLWDELLKRKSKDKPVEL
jgi:hypothetical protein